MNGWMDQWQTSKQVRDLKRQLLRKWRQEDCEFKASLGKVSNTLPQNQNTGLEVWLKW
jgi:hypothetical protein